MTTVAARITAAEARLAAAHWAATEAAQADTARQKVAEETGVPVVLDQAATTEEEARHHAGRILASATETGPRRPR
jgi:hypothetical protein